MNYVPKMNRRSFVVGTAAAGGGLALGFDLPFAARSAARAGRLAGTRRLGRDQAGRHRRRSAWPAPRWARARITGLAQLVAEELECDWSKVTTEYPTPGENVKRKRVWGDYSTGGSRGIRESHEYVRQGGAAARMMLLQAAANEWKVPVVQCTAANSVITARRPARRPRSARWRKPPPSCRCRRSPSSRTRRTGRSSASR